MIHRACTDPHYRLIIPSHFCRLYLSKSWNFPNLHETETKSWEAKPESLNSAVKLAKTVSLKRNWNRKVGRGRVCSAFAAFENNLKTPRCYSRLSRSRITDGFSFRDIFAVIVWHFKFAFPELIISNDSSSLFQSTKQ